MENVCNYLFGYVQLSGGLPIELITLFRTLQDKKDFMHLDLYITVMLTVCLSL